MVSLVKFYDFFATLTFILMIDFFFYTTLSAWFFVISMFAFAMMMAVESYRRKEFGTWGIGCLILFIVSFIYYIKIRKKVKEKKKN